MTEDNVGHRQVREMTRQHVQKIIAKRAATPGAANQLLKKLKVLLHFAIDNGWRTDDPTIRIKKFAEGEFHPSNKVRQHVAPHRARWSIPIVKPTSNTPHFARMERRNPEPTPLSEPRRARHPLSCARALTWDHTRDQVEL